MNTLKVCLPEIMDNIQRPTSGAAVFSKLNCQEEYAKAVNSNGRNREVNSISKRGVKRS